MAFSKFHRYPKEDQVLCAIMKALGHPARTKIIRQLVREGACTVKKISKDHPISQPAMSVHFRILRKVHLVKPQEEYPDTYYSVDPKNIIEAIKLLKLFLKDIKMKRPKS